MKTLVIGIGLACLAVIPWGIIAWAFEIPYIVNFCVSALIGAGVMTKVINEIGFQEFK